MEREVPAVPVFQDCPVVSGGPAQKFKNYRVVMSYFHPWVLDDADATEHVPVVNQLCQYHLPAGHAVGTDAEWEMAYKHWTGGNILSRRGAQQIRSFWTTYCIRPLLGSETAIASEVEDEPLSASEPQKSSKH